MKIGKALAEGSAALASGHSGSPNLDASLLLAHALGCTRARLLAMLPDELPTESEEKFSELVKRRNSGESVAYIVGHKEFYGRKFAVDPRVLVPRPETELLVEAALARLPAKGGAPIRCHDAFTGSGCVGITLACERPDIQMELSDASADALAVCRQNAAELCGAAVSIAQGDVLSSATGTYTSITANPPYVTTSLTDEIVSLGGREPRLALDGGPDGLDLYGRLAREAVAKLEAGGWLLAEIGDEQGQAVAALFTAAGLSRVEVLQDLAGHDRVVAGGRA